MKNTIKLDNPVQINDKSYDELTYDISEITAQAFAEADARKLSASGSKNGNAAGAAELDYGLHLYLGFAAIIAINPEIDISDLRQNMDAYFFSYFPELKPSPKGDTTHGPKTEQPRKQVEGQVRQPVRQPDRLDRGR